MKQKIICLLMLLLFLPGIILQSCHLQDNKKTGAASNNFYYTCPMHTQIREDKPGDCPICGMKLIKRQTTDFENAPSDSVLTYLEEPVTKTVVGNFKVISPAQINSGDTIMADGYIGFDKRAVNTIAPKIAGRIEKLYVKYTNQTIHKGQPLMEIYSPQLLSAQRDLLQTMQDNDSSLIKALKEKLVNMGMPPAEINRLIQTKKLLATITIYSPYDGISQKINPDQKMEIKNKDVPELLNMQQGMYVNSGQTIFSIQNINRIWAILNVFAGDMENIHEGDTVNLYADNNAKNYITAQINFVPPYRAEDEKTTGIRIYLKRLPEYWKIGTLIHGDIILNKKNTGWYVPLSAVNQLGTRDVVWVQDKRYPAFFHAAEVKVDKLTGNMIHIISGLQSGDKIVENAAYMTDSDSFI